MFKNHTKACWTICQLFISLFFTFFLPTTSLFAEPVEITAKSSAFANEEVVLLKYYNLITKTEEEIARTTADSTGKIVLRFNLEETSYVFAHLGIYQVYLYAEPGQSYEIILPPKTKKTLADQMNPYFAETYVHLATKKTNDKELNTAISMFDDTYNAYIGKYIIDNYERKNYDKLELELEDLEKVYKNYKNEYFKKYRYYKYGLINNSTLQQKSKSSFIQYFKNKPVLYENTAYMELFNQVFNEYFQYLARTDSGKVIYTHINTNKDYEGLVQSLQEQHHINNRQLLELVILQNIYNEFYKSGFSRSGLLSILEQLKNKTSYNENLKIANDIQKKITRLLNGYPPTDFKLYDADSNLVSLHDIKGKYIYLNFCTSNSYACFSEYEMLKTLNAKHSKYLTIVTVSTDNNLTDMKKFVESRGYDWLFLHYGNQPDVLYNYDIRVFPTYYLIDKEGKLIMSPAPSPRENFEAALFKILKSRGDI